MLPRNHRMELLSKAYVRAVAAHAGYWCDELESDFGVDLSIRGITPDRESLFDAGSMVDLQLKSTTVANVRFADEAIHYRLAVRNYRHLRKEALNGHPRLLVLFLLPEDETDWLMQDEGNLILRKCCYFLSLKGYADTANQHTVTVAIPLTNLFNVDFLRQTLQQRSGT